MTSAAPPLVITRFAPSPTGPLHLGGARTALVAWAYARQRQGQFIIRFEDTDPHRSSSACATAIAGDLTWLGLTADRLYYQSSRAARHCAVAQELHADGLAYAADGALRLKIPGALTIPFVDLVAGPISVPLDELTDPVLLRADGTPTYFLANALDDLDDGVSHVIRGDDHLINTLKQLYLFQALRQTPPAYAHLPMLLSPTGKKLSKRTADDAVPLIGELRTDGFLPTAVLNYLARLSWGHGDVEFFPPDFFIENFSFTHVSRSGARFDFAKLKWLNAQHLKKIPATELWALAGLPPLGAEVANLLLPRAHTLCELRELADYFVTRPAPTTVALPAAVLRALHQRWAALCPWTAAAIKSELQGVAEQHNLKFAELACGVRMLLTGRMSSPELALVAAALGQKETLMRLLAPLGTSTP